MPLPLKFIPACCLLVLVYGATHGAPQDLPTARDNPRLMSLPPNRWVLIHRQGAEDEVKFRRQPHGGACFDSRRGRIVLFGSDTHGSDWTNSPLVFDPLTAVWTRYYSDDPRDTYAVNAAGLPVAGNHGDHPWAMHTFGAVEYDPQRDEMIIACYPGHLIPGRFTNVMAELWPKVKKFPTWTFDFSKQQWQPLDCDAVHFFPQCTALDTKRNVVLGYRPDGIYELAGEPRQWRRLTKSVFLGGWHNNAAFDARENALVVFGQNENRNDVEVYYPVTGQHRLMPTSGTRPSKDQHNPMAYEPAVERTVVLVDRAADPASGTSQNVTETWLYDLAGDRWTQVPSATLPFACGMNYNLVYDSLDRCLLLVTGSGREPTTVWALRLAEDSAESADKQSNTSTNSQQQPIAEDWDYVGAMRKVAAKFQGSEGVVLHVGDSMTIANPYGTWARMGKGKTPTDEAVLRWMHTGANDKTDGWWLCRTEVVHERAYTSVGGMQSTHLIRGGNRGNATIAQMLADFRPRMVVLMVGIYDVDSGRSVEEYRQNMTQAVDQILDAGAICILSTFAPLYNRLELSRQCNDALRELARSRSLPLIDFEREILARRPDDWNGTLQRRDNIHLTAREAGGDPGTTPTAENLGKSGYLLRGWLSVQKIAEVKRRVLDER